MVTTTHAETTHLLTRLEAARRLAVSVRTLDGLAACGALPTVRIGRSVRYRPEDLASFIASRVSGAAEARGVQG